MLYSYCLHLDLLLEYAASRCEMMHILGVFAGVNLLTWCHKMAMNQPSGICWSTPFEHSNINALLILNCMIHISFACCFVFNCL